MDKELIILESKDGHKIWWIKDAYEEYQKAIKDYEGSEEYKALIKKVLYDTDI